MISRRFVSMTTIAALLTAVLIGSWGIYSYRRPLPQTEGAIRLEGLQADVTIYRDEWGVPHIYASTEHDLFLAQGYIHAQDRWWQMEMNRHMGMGQLSVITGNNEAVQNADRFVHTLGWYRAANISYRNASPEIRAVLDAYTQGVNDYIQDRDQGDLAVQYTLLGLTGRGFEVQPWQAVHSLAWTIAFNWQLGSDLTDELNEIRLLATLDPALAEDYLSASNEPGLDYAALASSLPDYLFEMAFFEQRVPPRANSWVVDGAHTDSGMPLLAADFQSTLDIPSQWYEIGLHCVEITPDCAYDVVGFSLTGIPGVVVGHNAQVAWSMTPAALDTQDLYLLPLSPDSPTRYLYQGEWQEMRIYNDVIRVNDAEPIRWTVYSTALGAIINQHISSPYALVLRWAGVEPADWLSAVLGINTAADWGGFRASLSRWQGAPQVFLYADVSGNIGMQVAGRIPLRPDDGSQSSATTPNAFWDELIPYEALTNAYNPARGWLVASSPEINGSINAAAAWDEAHRIQRVDTLLAESQQHNMDTFAAIQADTYNPFAAALVPILLELDFSEELDDQLPDFQAWLAGWNLHNDVDSPYPVLFAMLWARLVESVFDDQLNAETGGLLHQRYVLLGLLREPESPWWDDVRTPDITENRDMILRREFRQAIDDAQSQFGALRDRWRWGDLHVASFRSIPLGDSGVAAIDELLNRGSVSVGGGFSTLDSTSWSVQRVNRYESLTAPAFRMIIDLSNFEESRSILSTGESGHPASPHYDDMIDLWRSTAYRDMGWERNLIRDASETTLRLRPLVAED